MPIKSRIPFWSMALLGTGLYVLLGEIPAYAVDYEYAAVTEATAAARQGTVKAGSLTWQCAGDRCVIRGPWPKPALSSCKALAQRVGRLRSYGHGKAQLNAAQITQCNANATAVNTYTLAPRTGSVEPTPGGFGRTDSDKTTSPAGPRLSIRLPEKHLNPSIKESVKLHPTVPTLMTARVSLPRHRSPIDVTYVVSDGIAIWEDDIDITNDLSPKPPENTPSVTWWDGNGRASEDVRAAREPLSVTNNPEKIWPANTVPFEFDSSMPFGRSANRIMVDRAIAQLHSATNVRFVPYVDRVHDSRIKFVETSSIPGAGSSPIGRQGGFLGDGENTVRFRPNQPIGVILHEILHSLGAFHEQSRRDRDRFITINLEKVVSAARHNFDKHLDESVDLGEYDCASIMHYGPNAFLQPGLTGPVIQSVNPDCTTLGGGSLSALDIAGLNALYPPTNCSDRPVLFEDSNRRGRTLALDRGARTLGPFNFNDKASSLCVPPGFVVVLHNDDDFRGRSQRFTPGTFNLPSGINDSTNSVQVIGSSVFAAIPPECLDPVRGRVTLFEYDNFRGRRIHVDADAPRLNRAPFDFRDMAESVCVPPGLQASFSVDEFGRGAGFRAIATPTMPALLPDLKNAGPGGRDFHDKIDSVFTGRR